MKRPRLSFAFGALFLACFLAALGLPQALAQGQDGDQPGYVPGADEEELDPKWQKTVEF